MGAGEVLSPFHFRPLRVRGNRLKSPELGWARGARGARQRDGGNDPTLSMKLNLGSASG